MLDGQLHLLTPEGVHISLTPAGPARRALAWALDFSIWSVALSLFATLSASVLRNSAVHQGLMMLVLFVSYWGYPILFEVYGGGRTPGKRVTGLEVIRDDGLPVGWRESSLRNLLLVADFLPMAYAAGLFSMLFDARFRRLGDMVAGTLVVHRASDKHRAPMTSVEPLALPQALTPDQQQALIDFVERSQQLSPARAVELAELAPQLTRAHGDAALQKLRAFAAGLTQ